MAAVFEVIPEMTVWRVERDPGENGGQIRTGMTDLSGKPHLRSVRIARRARQSTAETCLFLLSMEPLQQTGGCIGNPLVRVIPVLCVEGQRIHYAGLG